MDPHENDEDIGEDYNPEQETVAIEGPSTLPVVPIVTGEENDEEVAKFRAKLYRWNDGQWKERGAGDLKLMNNKVSKKIRLIMRQDKTWKVIANHFVTAQQGFCELKALKTSEKTWVWTCYDFSDEEPKVEQLCVKFTTAEEVDRFKTEFEKALEVNGKSEVKEAVQEQPAEQAAEAPKE